MYYLGPRIWGKKRDLLTKIITLSRKSGITYEDAIDGINDDEENNFRSVKGYDNVEDFSALNWYLIDKLEM